MSVVRDAVSQAPPADDVAGYLAWRKGKGTGPVRAVEGLRCLADIPAQPIRWMWPGRIPYAKLCLLDGDPGTGKSTVLCDIAARVTTGRDWPDGARQRGRGGAVLMLNAEDGAADTVRPRIEAAGGDPARVLLLDHVADADGKPRPPTLPGDLEHIEQIAKGRRVRLVIVDVLNAYLGGGIDSHKDQDVRRALSQLAAVAERTGAAVVCVRHLNKAAALNNPMYRGGGSIGIIGQARAAHLAAADPDDPSGRRRVFAPVKLNIATLPAPLGYQLVTAEGEGLECARVEWLGPDPHSAGELLGQLLDAEERADRDEVVWWLQEYLSGTEHGRAPYADILAAARRHGIPERTLRRARTRAGVTYHRAGWQSGTIWALPSGPNEAIEASE